MARPRKEPEALPLRSPVFDVERTNIAAATEAFLARGGKIEQVGHNTPFAEAGNVLAHLFEPAPAAAPVTPRKEQAVQARVAKEATASLAGKVMAQAALGHPPRQIARSLGLTEKHVRQIGRDHHIQFRQR